MKAGIFALITAIFCISCAPEYETERHIPERRSLGTEVYEVLYDNTLRSPDNGVRRAEVLNGYREDVISALDGTITEASMSELNDVFKRAIPMYEKGLYQDAFMNFGRVARELVEDEKAVEALAYLDARVRFVSNERRSSLITHVLSYEGYTDILRLFVNLLRNHEDGSRSATHQFLKALSLEIETLSVNKDGFFLTIADRLLEENPIYAPENHQPLYFALFGNNGYPILPLHADTHVYSPFLDTDKNAVADTDAFGHFILSDGSRVAPFYDENVSTRVFEHDNTGRWLDRGKFLFRYADLQQTPLSYLLRESGALFRDKTLDQAQRALRTLLGEGSLQHDEHGSYWAFNTRSALFRLLSDAPRLLDRDEIGPMLEAAALIVENEQEPVAKLIHDLGKTFEIIDETPFDIKWDNDLLDQMLPIVLEIVKTPGLLEDIIEATRNPVTKELLPVMAELAAIKKDRIVTTPAYDACSKACNAASALGTTDHFKCIRACPVSELYGNEKVDRNAKESRSNQSLLQRILTLMWETTDTNYPVTIEKLGYVDENGVFKDYTNIGKSLGSLMDMNDLSLLYLKTAVGQMKLIDHINPAVKTLQKTLSFPENDLVGIFLWITESLYGIELSASPTTYEVTRFFNRESFHSNHDKYTMNLKVATCKSGHPCHRAHADTLFAIEASGLLDALQPLVAAFAKHDKIRLLTSLSVLLALHFPSEDYIPTDKDGKALPFHADNYRSVEPLLIKIAEQSDIFDSLAHFTHLLLHRELSDKAMLKSRLASYLTFMLTPDPSLKDADGRNHVLTPSGKKLAFSPFYLLFSPFREILRQIRDDKNLRTQLKDALVAVAGITVKTVTEADGKVRFEKPAGIRIISTAFRIVHDAFKRATANQSRSELFQNKAPAAVRRIVGGRLLHAYFKFFENLEKNDENLEKIRHFVLHVLDSDNNSLDISVAILKILILTKQSEKLLPLMQFAGRIIDPAKNWGENKDSSLIHTTLFFFDEFLKTDPNNEMTAFMLRLFDAKSADKSNVVKLINALKAIERVNPGTHHDLDARDMRKVLKFIADYFFDNERGIERIFKTIEFTIYGTAGKPQKP